MLRHCWCVKGGELLEESLSGSAESFARQASRLTQPFCDYALGIFTVSRGNCSAKRY